MTTEQLAQACAMINDMIAGSNIKATPGDADGKGFSISWLRVFPGKGEYTVTKGEAYQKLVQAGYNPRALVEFAAKQ